MKFKKLGGSENSGYLHQDRHKNFKIDQEMTEKIELKVGNPPKIKLKMGQFEPTLKIFLFLKARIINFFFIPVTQTYQNESAPIF